MTAWRRVLMRYHAVCRSCSLSLSALLRLSETTPAVIGWHLEGLRCVFEDTIASAKRSPAAPAGRPPS